MQLLVNPYGSDLISIPASFDVIRRSFVYNEPLKQSILSNLKDHIRNDELDLVKLEHM